MTDMMIDPVLAQEQHRLGRTGHWAAGGVKRLGGVFLSIAAMLLIWQLFLWIFHVDKFLGKGPLDVYRYLRDGNSFLGLSGAQARSILYHNSLTTLRDAFIGLIAGTVAAIVCAILFNVSRPAEQTFMPVAMTLRSVPLVAMTPLIALIFGRGLMCVTVIAGIVTFFPTLVNVTLALRSTPQASIDLFRAYGAGPVKTLRKVQLPNALPAIFASLRIAAPLALIGALLA